MKLADAVLCSNCDCVFNRKEIRVCPDCASPHYVVLELLFQNRSEDVVDVIELVKKIARLS